MTIPAHREVDLAFLLEIVRSGRPERPVEVVARVPQHFPDLTAEDLAVTRKDGRTKLFENMVHWARNHARERGFLRADTPPGVWEATPGALEGLLSELTARGVQREAGLAFIQSANRLDHLLGRSWASSKRVSGQSFPIAITERLRSKTAPERLSPFNAESPPNPQHASSSNEGDIKRAILARMNTMEGYEFEHLVARILDAAGLKDSQITGRSGDEGVDVITKLNSPFLSATVAVQVKRHSGNIGPKDISYLRDRWARRADKLLFITTSDYTPGAREVASDEREVTLINGSQLVDIMFEHQLGVRIKPMVTYEVEEDFFTG